MNKVFVIKFGILAFFVVNLLSMFTSDRFQAPPIFPNHNTLSNPSIIKEVNAQDSENGGDSDDGDSHQFP